MKTLRKNINKFYKRYNIANPDYGMRLTKHDMYDHDTLMTVYEDIWDNMAYYEGEDEVGYQWLMELYGEVGDYLANIPTKPNHDKAIAIFKLCVAAFGNVCLGIFITAMIEYGCCFETVSGIILAIILSISAGIGAYEDIKHN